MPHSTHGTVVLMGSGEMAPSMVEVHKYAMSLVDGPARPAFVDTPAGFQLNADLLAQKAVEYFDQHLNSPLAVASFKDAATATDEQRQQAIRTLHDATYIFAGPGSPIYAIRNWRHTPVFDAIAATLKRGGCITFASAAALTLGRFTIAVYEVYKVGDAPHWVDGLDVLSQAGLDVAVVPHWNNTSGGDHDTTFCFMGEPRWRVLKGQLPPGTVVLGIDEHTAAILRFDANVCEVRGVGQVTVQRGAEERVYTSGDSFSLDLLRSDPSLREAVISASPAADALSWESLRARREALMATQPPSLEEGSAYIYDLLSLLGAARAAQDWPTMQRAEEALREALLHLLMTLDAAPVDEDAIIAPYVELLLRLRADLREAKQWAQADAVRDGLIALGLEINDGPGGTTWQRAI